MMMKMIGLIALLLALLFEACGVSLEEPIGMPEPGAPPAQESGSSSDISDQASFITALEAQGAVVEESGFIDQPFFSVGGNLVNVNGVDLQVFDYPDVAAAEMEAATINPSGSSVGTSMMTWIEPPHFYQKGQLIVLYLGTDQEMLDLLASMLGPQIAGQ